MKLVYPEYVRQAYEESDDGIIDFTCASCNEKISSEKLVTPCHPKDGFAEGSGHGGYPGYSVYCAFREATDNAYCGWGGPLTEYEPQLLCGKCLSNPWIV